MQLFLEIVPFCISLQLCLFITIFMVNNGYLSESHLIHGVASGFIDEWETPEPSGPTVLGLWRYFLVTGVPLNSFHSRGHAWPSFWERFALGLDLPWAFLPPGTAHLTLLSSSETSGWWVISNFWLSCSSPVNMASMHLVQSGQKVYTELEHVVSPSF